MDTQVINDEWLFKVNPRDEISKWVNNLKFSYFWRRPSFRDEGDYIITTLNFIDKEDLLRILSFFKIELNRLDKGFSKPITGKQYVWSEFKEFKNEIKDFPEFEQPGNLKINNRDAFVWIENKEICFSFSGSSKPYEVGNVDFENCLHIESIINTNHLVQKVNRDIESNIGCIAKSKYPAL
jgi:hypothetical protein